MNEKVGKIHTVKIILLLVPCMNEKVGKIQPLNNFCTRLINPTVHMAFRLHVYLDIVSVFS